MGVSEAAVSQWMTRARTQGPAALQHRPPPGVPRRLSASQLASLPELLHRGAEAYGFRAQVWTRARVAAVIHLAYGQYLHHPVISIPITSSHEDLFLTRRETRTRLTAQCKSYLRTVIAAESWWNTCWNVG
jgi:hypothetical protein